MLYKNGRTLRVIIYSTQLSKDLSKTMQNDFLVTNNFVVVNLPTILRLIFGKYKSIPGML